MVTVTTTYQNDEAEPVRQGWLVVPFGLNSLMQWGTRPLPPHRGLARGQIFELQIQNKWLQEQRQPQLACRAFLSWAGWAKPHPIDANFNGRSWIASIQSAYAAGQPWALHCKRTHLQASAIMKTTPQATLKRASEQATKLHQGRCEVEDTN